MINRAVNSIEIHQDMVLGAKSIAYILGCSVDTVYTYARTAGNGCPVYLKSGKYFALHSELETWKETHPKMQVGRPRKVK